MCCIGLVAKRFGQYARKGLKCKIEIEEKLKRGVYTLSCEADGESKNAY